MPSRRLLLTFLAAAAASACSTPPAFAVGGLVDMQIVDRGRSSVLATWGHDGATYVAGRPGDRYAVRLTNRSGARVLVVLSVDGVNAVSGETAAVGQTGYVLDAWESADIAGWRKSRTQAAAFYFTALPDSYAARTDRPGNVGVIGAAVFRERVLPPRRKPVPPPSIDSRRSEDGSTLERESRAAEPSSSNDAAAAEGSVVREGASSQQAPAASPARRDSEYAARSAGSTRSDKLGTGHGEREYSPVGSTAFERATTRPAENVQVRYDSYSNLLASGVIAPRHRPQPDPFPSGFVPDPR